MYNYNRYFYLVVKCVVPTRSGVW